MDSLDWKTGTASGPSCRAPGRDGREQPMTTDRQCRAKSTNRSGRGMGAWVWFAIIMVAMAGMLNVLGDMASDRSLRELLDRVTELELQATGRQQGVSDHGCGQTAPDASPQLQQNQHLDGGPSGSRTLDPRIKSPLSTCTQYKPEAKLAVNPGDFGARSAPGCAGLYADRVSGGRQEVRP